MNQKGAEHPGSASLRAYARKEGIKTAEKVRKTMRVIEKEVEEEGGLYPYNKGKVTQAELARRAGIKQSTLQKSQHRELKKEVNEWLSQADWRMARGKPSIRRAVTDQIQEWKEQYHSVLQAYHEDKLELIEARARIECLQTRIEDLERENIEFRNRLSEGTVTNIESAKTSRSKNDT